MEHPQFDSYAEPEYLIRRADGDWFDLHSDRYAEALRPNSVAWRRVEGWGSFRIEVAGTEIVFSFEDPGIQISFEGPLPQEQCDRITEEIRQNIERVTGQRARTVPL